MTTRNRWILYIALLGLTLIAVRWTASTDRPTANVVGPVAPSRDADAVRPPIVVVPQISKTADLDLERLNRGDHKRPSADPFRTLNWDEAEEATRLRAQRPEVQAPPPPPEAPPLPYTYIGRLIEHGKTAVFLTIQDRVAIARIGDTLDGRYRVEAISERAITFNYLPLEIRQQLMLTAGANPGEAASQGASQGASPPRPVASARTPTRRANEEDED